MTRVAPGLYYRHLELEEVLARIKKRHVAEIARHNAHVVEGLGLGERTAPRRDQVLAEFSAQTRRLLK